MEIHPSCPTAKGQLPNYHAIQEESTLDVNAFETTQNSPWDPWSPTDPSVFPGSSGAADTIGCIWGQGSFPPSDYVSGYPLDYPDLTNDFSTVTPYTAPSLASEPIAPDASSASSDSWHRSLATEKKHPKRKQSPKHEARKSTKVDSYRDGDIDKHWDEMTENLESRSRTSRTRRSRKNGENAPAQKADGQDRKTQERNRVAANKCRVKRREEVSQLKSKEEELERRNRDLSACVADLTREVYELKVKLLQHTDCNCALIHSYIASEAQRYFGGMGEQRYPSAQTPCDELPHFTQRTTNLTTTTNRNDGHNATAIGGGSAISEGTWSWDIGRVSN